MSVLGTCLYQVLAGIVVRGYVRLQWIFGGKTQKCTCPHWAECSAVFEQKQHDLRAPPSLFTWPCPEQHFCFPHEKKSSKRSILLMWKRWNRNSRSTKRRQNWQVQNLFGSEEKCLNGCITSNGVLWRWLKFKHVSTNTQFFINKLCFGGPPSYLLRTLFKTQSQALPFRSCKIL